MPNLPTDNLYKFIALSGVFLFGFALYFITVKSEQISTKIYITDAEDTVQLNVKNKILNREVSELSLKVEEYKKSSDMYSEKINEFIGKDIVNFKKEDVDKMKKLMSEFKEHQSGGEEIENIIQELKAKIDESEYIKAKVKLANEHTSKKIKELDEYRKYAMFLLFFSSLMAYGGFQAWYLKLQRYQDQIVKNQATQQSES
ncbi:TPA: hypothetical protein ACGF9M_003801 [Vibrio cholerae]